MSGSFALIPIDIGRQGERMGNKGCEFSRQNEILLINNCLDISPNTNLLELNQLDLHVKEVGNKNLDSILMTKICN